MKALACVAETNSWPTPEVVMAQTAASTHGPERSESTRRSDNSSTSQPHSMLFPPASMSSPHHQQRPQTQTSATTSRNTAPAQHTHRSLATIHKNRPQRGLSKFYHKKARSFACLSNLFKEKDARVLAKETRRDEDDAVSDTASLVDRGVPLMVGDTDMVPQHTSAWACPPFPLFQATRRELSPGSSTGDGEFAPFVTSSALTQPLAGRRAFSCRTFASLARCEEEGSDASQ